ncbi:YifB family Mg chelatase-like AAA ATPase [Sphaerimonospora sp. CA-214678]|uniref:YifB family Mg chelatase-like AAA ATPase n=1 Tax=Sphaerimonospora sp. CA-214678 TaxID=3240029 RepID=UPI003D94DD36
MTTAYASTRSVALVGLDPRVVDIEADAVPGPAELHLVGLPELSVWPARARIRSAIFNSGTAWPDAKVTVSISPEIPPVYDAAADLALTLAALAACGVVPPERIAGRVFLGELALDGGICPIRGVLPAVRAAVTAGLRTVVVPADCAPEAAQVPGAVVVPVTRLGEVIDRLRNGTLDAYRYRPPEPSATVARPPGADLADVPGNEAARRALEVCAAGGHHLFLTGDGPATMLAERLPGILPPLGVEAAREVAEIYSLAGRSDRAPGAFPPLCAPHHTSTPAAIFGSVAANRPGAVSLAHRGVLHLADAPEFGRPALDGLSRPMDTGEVRVTGLGRTVRYPARFTLVLDARRCPCPEGRECACTPVDRRRYLHRLALLLPRIAIRAPVAWENSGGGAGESSAAVATRVVAARLRAGHRLAETPWRTNAEVPALELRTSFAAEPEAVELLRSAVNTGLLTVEGFPRLLRVAWTLADLRGADRPGVDDAAGALELWKGADGEGR